MSEAAPVRTNVLSIRTPEGVSFSMPLAGPVPRFLAWFIDLMVIMVIGSAVSVILGIFGVLSLDLANALAAVTYFVLSIGYGIALEWFLRGQTIGKRLFRIRVIDIQGLRLRPSQVFIRNFLRFVDSMPAFYFLGGTASLVSRYSQRLGDLAANTVVVRIPKVTEPDLKNVLQGKYNSLRDHPHLAARLRQRVSPAGASLGLKAVMRRDTLDPLARVELFHDIAEHYRSLVSFPEEAVQGVSDEQYVRNVVDVLFVDRRPSLIRKKKKEEPESIEDTLVL